MVSEVPVGRSVMGSSSLNPFSSGGREDPSAGSVDFIQGRYLKCALSDTVVPYNSDH